ncbi:MAG: hypothetical protein O2894_08590, partial [Planctomycetota bacterium]|nr:hypothetical protein [Planctomycetota bacterium]
MPSLKTLVELQFGGRCQRPPQGVHFVPGRARLLATPTRVVTASLAEGVACAWGMRPDSRVVVWAMNARQKDSFHLDGLFRCGRPWSDLARGAYARVAADRKRMPGVDLLVQGDLPSGEGLASSGAYTIAILRSLYEAVGEYRSRWELAEDVPAIERDWLGREGSTLDPYILAAAKPRQVLVVEADEPGHTAFDLPDEHAFNLESLEGEPLATPWSPADASEAARVTDAATALAGAAPERMALLGRLMDASDDAAEGPP